VSLHPVPKPVIVIDPPRRKWVATLPCCVCQARGMIQRTPTECAHVDAKRNAGDEDNLAPICRDHHTQRGDSLHRMGIKSFQAHHGVDLKAIAKKVARDYRQEFLA
jgi:hypothetical protein